MKFRRRGPAILIACALLLISAVTAVAHFLTNGLLESAHDGDYTLMRQVFADTLSDAQDEVVSRAEIVAAMPEVRTAFAARDRPKLLATTKRMWEIQDQRYELNDATFHVPPGISFLRLSKPEVFGQDQSSSPLLADVHQLGVVKKGLTIARSGPAIVGIAPVTDDAGKMIGSFGMVLDFAPQIDKIKHAYGLEAVLFFDEKMLRDTAADVPADIFSPRNQVGRFIRFHTTNPELARALVTDKDVDVSEPKSYEREYARTSWGVQLVPIYNHASKRIGVAALATDFGEDKRLARRAFVWQLLAALFAVVLMTGAILVVIRGFVLAPIASLGKSMAAGEAPDELDSYCEEVREVATAYTKIRAGRDES